MPTGYTAKLCKEEISFEEFFLTCARAFCHIELRDDPLAPIPLTPYKTSSYRLNRKAEDHIELDRLQSLTPEKAEAEAEAEYQERLGSWKESKAKAEEIRGRLEAMLEQAQAWEPPTERHENFKKFMIEQLTETIKHDGTNLLPEPERKPGREWLEQAITNKKNSIFRTNEWEQEEKQRTADNNKWITDLVESIGLEIQEREETPA